jgi:hypothetical protein
MTLPRYPDLSLGPWESVTKMTRKPLAVVAMIPSFCATMEGNKHALSNRQLGQPIVLNISHF